MKKLLLPLIAGVLGGITSASAASIVTAKKGAAAYAAYVVDSTAKHVKDSTAAADSLEKEHKAKAEEEAAAEALMTPADSIREAQHMPTTLKAATKGLANASEHGAPADPKHGAPAAAPSGHDTGPKPVVTPATKSAKPKPAATAPPAPVKLPEAIESALPENRIAKIFSAMPSKEAAKVLEQMSDSDIRVILGKMGDKQAAAILIAFPAARAAAISKGESSKPETRKPETKADSSKKDSSGAHK